MVKRYSKDRKLALLWKYEEVKSLRGAAKFCRVSKSSAQRWIQDYKDGVAKVKTTKPTPTKLLKVMEFVKAHIDENPFMTCVDIAVELSVSKELVRLCLHKLNLSYKRARYYGKAKNSIELTCRFLNLRDKFIAEGRPIYSVDETGFGRFSYQCRMGWCTAGEKLRIMKDKASEISQTVIACASNKKWEHCSHLGHLRWPWRRRRQDKGGTNRSTFCSFLKTLTLPEGSVIILDNASIHKGDDVNVICQEKKLIALYSPPYSPWFNPVEGCFSIVKRAYLGRRRRPWHLWCHPKLQNIQACFDLVKESAFESHFRHSLNAYGMNLGEEKLHKDAMMVVMPDNAEKNKHRKRRQKTTHTTSEPKKEVSISKEEQPDGTILISRAVKTTVATTTVSTKNTVTESTTTTRTTSYVKKTKLPRQAKKPPVNRLVSKTEKKEVSVEKTPS